MTAPVATRARVLVTGASGFVGTTLCEALANAGYLVRAAVRSERVLPASIAEQIAIGELGSHTAWSKALEDVDSVVHLAARAHVLNDPAGNDAQYMEVNARGTAALMNACLTAGVRQFVYLSSVKVNGEATHGRAYTALDEPLPRDAYGVSKSIAERSLLELAAPHEISLAILRPPLVYGPGVRANFLRLMRWADRGIPLPFAAIHNRRSLVSVWNLCDLILRLLAPLPASHRVWMVSDGCDLSTPELIERMGVALGRRPRLLSVPVPVLQLLGTLSGRRAEVRRLCGSLQVDIAATRNDLGWTPPVSVDEALARTAAWYVATQR